LACGSDDAPSGSGGASGTATNEAGKHSGGGGSGSGSAAGGGGSHAGGGGGSAAGGGGSHAGTSATAGSSSGGASTLSPACQKFCDCHQANCATLAIPGGKSCGDFCEAMTEDQLACRQNMCKLVPDQPDNDHCKHSLGIDQCL
jgi:hypothetical protein